MRVITVSALWYIYRILGKYEEKKKHTTPEGYPSGAVRTALAKLRSHTSINTCCAMVE